VIFRYKQPPLVSMDTMFGPYTSGSWSIQPQMHHTVALTKLAQTSGPGRDLLSFNFSTDGTVTSTDMAPTKLQKDEMRPVRKSARPAGSTKIAHICRTTSDVTALRYLWKLWSIMWLRQCLKKATE
jgi:hypothetical protein